MCIDKITHNSECRPYNPRKVDDEMYIRALLSHIAYLEAALDRECLARTEQNERNERYLYEELA